MKKAVALLCVMAMVCMFAFTASAAGTASYAMTAGGGIAITIIDDFSSYSANDNYDVASGHYAFNGKNLNYTIDAAGMMWGGEAVVRSPVLCGRRYPGAYNQHLQASRSRTTVQPPPLWPLKRPTTPAGHRPGLHLEHAVHQR